MSDQPEKEIIVQHGNAPSPGDAFYYRYGLHILQSGKFITPDKFEVLYG
jgi:hypothetical protein